MLFSLARNNIVRHMTLSPLPSSENF